MECIASEYGASIKCTDDGDYDFNGDPSSIS